MNSVDYEANGYNFKLDLLIDHVKIITFSTSSKKWLQCSNCPSCDPSTISTLDWIANIREVFDHIKRIEYNLALYSFCISISSWELEMTIRDFQFDPTVTIVYGVWIWEVHTNKACILFLTCISYTPHWGNVGSYVPMSYSIKCNF